MPSAYRDPTPLPTHCISMPVCLSGLPREHFTLLPMSQMLGSESCGRNIALFPQFAASTEQHWPTLPTTSMMTLEHLKLPLSDNNPSWKLSWLTVDSIAVGKEVSIVAHVEENERKFGSLQKQPHHFAGKIFTFGKSQPPEQVLVESRCGHGKKGFALETDS